MIDRYSLTLLGGYIFWLLEYYIFKTTQQRFNAYLMEISYTFHGAIKIVLGYLLLCGLLLLILYFSKI